MEFTIEEIAERIGGTVRGDASRKMLGVSPVATAGPDQLTFASDAKRVAEFLATDAGAAIVPPGAEIGDRDGIDHPSPYAGFAAAIGIFHPPVRPDPGISPDASVHPSATVHESATVDAFAVVGKECQVAEGVVISAGCIVGPGCTIGRDTVLEPNVVLYGGTILGEDCVLHSGVVIGGDGFGFTRVDGRHVKIPQVGHVEIGNDVEIGSNSCVDRGTLDPTRIGDNTKLDDLVMVGHNSDVGRSVIFCSKAGIGGSTIVEDHAIFQPRAGAIGHVRIGKGTILYPGTGVLSDTEPGSYMMGVPAVPKAGHFRGTAMIPRLPEMRAELRRLRKRMEDLERRILDEE